MEHMATRIQDENIIKHGFTCNTAQELALSLSLSMSDSWYSCGHTFAHWSHQFWSWSIQQCLESVCQVVAARNGRWCNLNSTTQCFWLWHKFLGQPRLLEPISFSRQQKWAFQIISVRLDGEWWWWIIRCIWNVRLQLSVLQRIQILPQPMVAVLRHGQCVGRSGRSSGGMGSFSNGRGTLSTSKQRRQFQLAGEDGLDDGLIWVGQIGTDWSGCSNPCWVSQMFFLPLKM